MPSLVNSPTKRYQTEVASLRSALPNDRKNVCYLSMLGSLVSLHLLTSVLVYICLSVHCCGLMDACVYVRTFEKIAGGRPEEAGTGSLCEFLFSNHHWCAIP